eukprot:scaffold312213_cov17-Tisochrysis_lutea.AAC.1
MTTGDGCVSWRGAVSVKAAASTWDGPPVVIAGAGIAGLASAVALNKVRPAFATAHILGAVIVL